MRKLVFISTLVFITLVTVRAQNPVFSQFYTSSLYLNPALCGLEKDVVLGLNYRSQWTGVNLPFRTFQFSVIHPFILHGVKSKHLGGFGATLFSDEEAVATFLAKQGVDETSLAIIPKGKQNMKQAATEIQRQYNRRAEFLINGVRDTMTSSVKTYILRKETDWSMIAKLTGISEEELKNLNGAQTDIIKAFQPIRLPINARSISDDLFLVGI